MRRIGETNIHRLLDANFNRSLEALRVCEDICRFIFAQPRWTRAYKNARHALRAIELTIYARVQKIAARNIREDVGRKSGGFEFRRRHVKDIFWANSQRLKESLRVLEEFAKLFDVTAAQKIKTLRYRIYDLEKKVVEQF